MYVVSIVLLFLSIWCSRLSQILKVSEIEKTADIRRPYIKQLLTPNLKFPLPHRVAKVGSKKLYAPTRPSTFY